MPATTPREAARFTASPVVRASVSPAPAAAVVPGPAPSAAAIPAPTVAIAAPAAQRDVSPSHRARDEQLGAAESALERGDFAAAATMAAPWAAVGVAHAQALLGRAKEANRTHQRSDFEAYVWYSMAARGGEPGAQAMKEKVASRLQPAEIRQAEHVVEQWKPRTETDTKVAP
jgi:hypothetical protein